MINHIKNISAQERNPPHIVNQNRTLLYIRLNIHLPEAPLKYIEISERTEGVEKIEGL